MSTGYNFFFREQALITCIIKKIVHMIPESRKSHHKQTWNSHPTSPGRTCKSETWIQGRLYLRAWQYLKCQKSTGRKIQASRRQTQKRHQPSAKISGIGLMISVTWLLLSLPSICMILLITRFFSILISFQNYMFHIHFEFFLFNFLKNKLILNHGYISLHVCL